MNKAARRVVLAMLLLLAGMASSSRLYVPVTHADSGIAGYAYSQALTITNPATTTVGGSVVGGTVPATSTDYVVEVQLTGSQAAAVYGQARDKSSFSDVTVWWFNGLGFRQIDVDADVSTHGAWGIGNVTLWFKLQSPIVGGASDSNYMLAWGNSSPVVKQNWNDIYPFQDNFSAWNATLWGTQPSWVTVGDGTLTIASTPTGGTRVIKAVDPYVSYGPGYAVSTRMEFPAACASSCNAGAGFNGTSFQLADLSFSTAYPYSYFLAVSNGQSNAMHLGSLDTGSYHVYSVARAADGIGTSYGWTDAQSAISTTVDVSSTAIAGPYLQTDNYGSAFYSMSYSWMKVRPWQPQEPIAALVGSPMAASTASTSIGMSVTGGSLSLSVPASLTGGGVTLNGMAQTFTTTLPLTVTDGRGTGSGWTLALSMADPVNGVGQTLPFHGMTFSPTNPTVIDPSSGPASTLTSGATGALSGADTTPGVTSSTPFALLTASPTTGMGSYTQTDGVAFMVPADAPAGTYIMTATVSVQ